MARLQFTLLLLVANLLAVGVYLYLSGSRTEQSTAAPTPLLPQASNLTRLEIRPHQGPAIVLQARRQGWFLEEPFRWWANDAGLRPILLALERLEALARISNADLAATGATLADYGLQPPLLKVTVQSIEGPPETLAIGSSTSLGRRLYVLPPDGQGIAVVPEDLLIILERPLGELIDPSVFDLEFFEVDGLTVQVDQQRTTLRKSIDGWAFETPVSAAANQEITEAVLGSLISLRATDWFRPEQLTNAQTGLESPRLRITLQAGDRLRSLTVGAEMPLPTEAAAHRFARLEGTGAPETLFTLPSRELQWLESAQEFLRERRFWKFDPLAVTTAQIDQGSLSVTLQKLEDNQPGDASAWQIVEPRPGEASAVRPADTHLTIQWLQRLANLEAFRFVSDAPGPSDEREWGLTNPLARIRLEVAGKTSTLLIGARSSATPPFYYAKLEDQRFVYGLPPGILAEAQASPLRFRQRLLFTPPRGAMLTRIDLIPIGDNRPQWRLERDGDQWAASLTPTPLSERQKSAAAALATLLPRWQVANYLGNQRVEPIDAPWVYRLEATFTTPGIAGPASGGNGGAGGSSTDAAVPPREAETFRLWLTERLGGTRQIGGSDQPAATFLLTTEAIDALTPFLLEANLPPVPQQPSEITPSEPRPSPPPGPETGPRTP